MFINWQQVHTPATSVQLAWLNKLKEGAENLLSTNLTVRMADVSLYMWLTESQGPPRVQAESELKMAKNTIDAITERIETSEFYLHINGSYLIFD